MARTVFIDAFVPVVLLLLALSWQCEGAQHGTWKEQQEADRVELPGQPKVKFAQYAGMVTVNETVGKEFFYFFTEAQKHADKKPLVLWLNGGPGCSSLAYGFAREFGPYRIFPNGSGVYLDNDHAWNREANTLFLESPSGVGFSFSKVLAEMSYNNDNKTADDNYQFLLNWFERFPQYKGRDFYIAGESYAGHYVPQLARRVIDRNAGAKTKINLKGIYTGNPTTHRYWDHLGQFDYWRSHAMISDEMHAKFLKKCNYTDPDCCSHNQACNEVYGEAYTDEIGLIDPYSIYTKECEPVGTGAITTRLRTAHVSAQSNNPFARLRMGSYDPCASSYSEVYFNLPEVQKALHVNVSGYIPYPWTGCNGDLLLNWAYSEFSVLDHYHALIKAGVRVFIVSGDADGIVPVTGTRYSIAAMKLKVKSPWRAWYHHKQVGGRVEEYEGLTFVTVRGAGHETPYLKPAETLHIFQAFLNVSILHTEPYE